MEKKYKYNGGVLEETQDNGMLGFTYVQDGVNKRIINESTAIYNHAEYAESKFVIQAQIGQTWVTVSTESAIINKGTYCYANGNFEPNPFEMVDDLTKPIVNEQGEITGYEQKQELKEGLNNEWDFYFPMFFTAGQQAPSLHSFVKHGAELKVGVTL